MASFTRTGSATRAERRAEVAQRLMGVIEAAVEQGLPLSELTVERLSADAGLSRSSFYRYFADAGDLLRTIGRTSEAERSRTGLAIFDVDPAAGRDAFVAAVHEFVRVGWEHRLVIRLLTDATMIDSGLREDHEQRVAQAAAYIAAHIRRGQRAGWVRPELHGPTVAHWLVHMADRGLSTIIEPAPAAGLPEIADALAVTLWRTLYDGHRDPAGGT